MNSPERSDLSAVEIAKLEGQMMAGFAEVGGKLDTVIQRLSAAETSRTDDRKVADQRHEDHEARIRTLESHNTGDHEGRLDALDARKTIAPWQLWTAVLGGVTVVGIVVGIVASIIDLTR